MRKSIYILSILLICCLLPRGSSAVEFRKTKIAVLDFQLQGQSFGTRDMGAIVAEWFVTAFVKDGRFDVVERVLLTKILDEQKLAMTGIIDESTASTVGKLLGVKAIISGTVVNLGGVVEINARIIDVESGSIITAENMKGTATMQLQWLVVQMAKKIIVKFPVQGYVVRRQDNDITIDLGRLNGVKRGMDFIVYREGKVIKHPKTGKVLDVERITTGKIKIKMVMDTISDATITQEEKPGEIAFGQMVSSMVMSIPGGENRLYVNTHPKGARVRILNIVPRYSPGIKLSPGNFHIEVSARGYTTQKRWISITPGEDKQLEIILDPKASVSISPAVNSFPAPKRKTPPPQPVRRKISPIVKRYLHLLQSDDPAKIRSAARDIARAHSQNKEILKVVNDTLLNGYRRHPDNRMYQDAMAWLCNVLGKSRKKEFRKTLKTVAKYATSRKLKRYAKKNLSKLH